MTANDTQGWLKAFAPASVANVACGFDVFGFAVEKPGDVVAVRRRREPGVILTEVVGDRGRLPRETARNTAGIAAASLLAAATAAGDGRELPGVELRLQKCMPLRSGLGSSAASAVAAVVAVDALLRLESPRELLLRAAVEGERVACGTAHYDNAAASLYGGFVLVRPGSAPAVVELPVPEGLTCALVRPHLEIDTGESRARLGEGVALADAVTQWGNTAALVAGLFSGDLELISSALHDAIVEPLRAPGVPGFKAIQAAALEAGALGCSLSGSGPAVFALCPSLKVAQRTATHMAEAARAASGLDCDVLVSPVGARGARVLADGELPCAF